MIERPFKTKPDQPLYTKPEPGRARKAPTLPKTDSDPDEYPNKKTLMQRGPHDCCWPLSSSQPWFYCGERTVAETSYCKAHHEKRRDPNSPLNKAQAARKLIRSLRHYK